MDVSLILTHRCNLDCGYCYAGEHHKTDIEDAVLRRGVDLLFADGSSRAQLSFFGGEPFLAFDAMRRAVALAEGRAEEHGATLTLQCTTNGTRIREEQLRFILDHGVHVTVSIDGIREAHDLHRPSSGGKPSFDAVVEGLRTLVRAGASVDAMMVISPRTAQHAYLSANFLWSEGVRTVRANLVLDEEWTSEERAELREQLVSIGWELLARRLRGEPVSFKPFEPGLRARVTGAPTASRVKVVVGTSGHLYPCAPMVGEDRDDGPEAALRIGHVTQDPAAIRAAATRDGVRCENGKGCQCAAYLETGSRYTPGQMGRWYGLVCEEIGRTIAESLEQQWAARAPTTPRRRGVIMGLAAIVGGAAVGAPLLSGLLAADDPPRPCPLRTRKLVAPLDPEELPVPGEMAVPDPEPMIDGDIAEPEPPAFEPTPEPDGGIGSPW